jgi:hypothetical protein
VFLAASAGCGGSTGPSLDDFLPEVPAPTGEPQAVWAGPITMDNPGELIPGPAASGMIGDFFMRNARGRYVIQAATRVIGAVPQGGNLVDAVPVGPDGVDLADDHFGELSAVYLLGRTCEHSTMEVVQDGSGGGAAVLRARGVTATNDFINFRGIGLFTIPASLDPDIDDRVECATTYVLEPDASRLRVMWTYFNPEVDGIRGPFAAFNDTGGEVAAWSPTRGFERLGIGSIADLGEPAPIEYTLYQSHDLAYGVLPRHPDPAISNAAFVISGISVVLFGGETLLDILDDETFYMDLPGKSGVTYQLDLALGRDAAAIDEVFRADRDEPVAEIAGSVSWAAGGAATGARVGLFRDVDGDGVIGGPDLIESYMDVDSSGSFSRRVRPGNYLVRAEVKDLARGDTTAIALDSAGARDLELSLPDPVYFDYSITDATGALIPARITVIGRHPARPDRRLFDIYDRAPGAVATVHALRGTSVDLIQDPDPRLVLPAGSTYRILVSRGTEWSVASQVVSVEPGTPSQELQFTLHHVAPAEGYVASEYHVHQIGSMDAPVNHERRVASVLAEGLELFASTDHDYVSDLQPVIETLGVAALVRNIPGLEVTPFAYGHFNAWPITPDRDTPNLGAIDWARGAAGYAMIPGEIFSAMRARGAQVVQINHPRSTAGVLGFLQFFDRAGLQFDYQGRQIIGDLASAPVPNDWLRLPEVSLWDDGFNALEVWNRISVEDSNGDGVREIASLDIVMRDWFNFLTLGLEVSPMGNSDTHEAYRNPAGMPRTYVRVGDDSAAALESGDIVADTLATLSGAMSRDIVVTNGPHIQVSVAGQTSSALGAVIDGTSGAVTLDVTIVAPDWAAFDTLEIFANATPDVNSADTLLQPLSCFTSRAPLDIAGNDVCALTPRGPQALEVSLVEVTAGVKRYQASVQVTIAADDIVNHASATGRDAWLVFRVRGDRAVFPLMLDDVITSDTLDILVSGAQAEVDAVLQGAGVPATAFTSPVFVDFDGSGYSAVLSPR